MQIDNPNIKELVKFNAENGMIRFAGHRALVYRCD